ncbi:MAG: GYD domain-containing protein [Actinobacteria bacterium]|nr:GYD domain-containing protein [Actinomycetota bacterium]
MPKYMFGASLTAEGVQGIRQEGGSARREVVRKAVEALGGTLEGFYFAFGGTDVITIADLPDATKAAAFSLATSASGRVRVSTTVLLSPEEMDEAARQEVDWRPPGG